MHFSIQIHPFVVGNLVACYTCSNIPDVLQSLDVKPHLDAMMRAFVVRFKSTFHQMVSDPRVILSTYVTHPMTEKQRELIYIAIRKQKIRADVRRLSDQEIGNFQMVLENMLQPQQSSPTH